MSRPTYGASSDRVRAFIRARLSPEGALGLHVTIGGLLLVIFAWMFGAIAEDVATRDPLVQFDLRVSTWFEFHSTPGITHVMRVVTTIGAWPVTTAITIALGLYFTWRHYRYWLTGLLLTVPAGAVLNVALKHAFHRTRPRWEHPLVMLTSFSFPSGHAMSAATLYGFIGMWAAAHYRSTAVRAAIGLAVLAWVSLIAFSRIYLGAHYPSDVLGGMTAGAAWLTIVLTGVHVEHRRGADLDTSEQTPNQVRSSEPPAWHAIPSAAAVAQLHADAVRGLTHADSQSRSQQHGANELPAERDEPWWKEAFEALTEPLVLLLLAVGALYALFGRAEDAVTIFAVIVAVAAIETTTEARAKRAVRSLASLAAPEATAVRDGEPQVIDSRDLVPGDIVLLQAGRRVPADVRLLTTAALRVDESSLTGEAATVAKAADVVLPPDTPIGDRRNLGYMGTLVVAGQGRGVVVATGRSTELGRIASLAGGGAGPPTPLQRQLANLAASLLWLAIAFSVAIPILSVVIARRPWRDALLEGLTLAFATIPEELPILVTVVLGLGAYRLAQQRAITKRLQAAETLGSVSVIGTDKTGTLTENQMQVVELVVDGRDYTLDDAAATPNGRRLLTVGMLATDAEISPAAAGVQFIGDPTDTALLTAADRVGLLVGRDSAHVLAEFPFDDQRKRIGAVYVAEGERWLAVKGAPERVLDVCTRIRLDGREDPLDQVARRDIFHAIDRMSDAGRRVIAFAERRLAPDSTATLAVETDLTFLGLAGLEDPLRPGVSAAIAALQRASVRVVMITGDHAGTARAIAAQVGLPADRLVTGREITQASDELLRELVRDISVFARVSPEDKLRLVAALQADGDIVGVTGDGVNDAPALRQAEIGIAMGRRGTDVAREAADLILRDDNFATVTLAVRGGRVLFDNLRKAVRFYLAAKVALILSTLAAALAALPLPFAPVQIIVLELFMDVGASTTFVVEPPEGDVMARPPRDPRRPFLDRAVVWGVLAGGISLAAAVLVVYLPIVGFGYSVGVARSAAFSTWLIGHIVLAAHMRSEGEPLIRRGLRVTRPFALWAAAAVGLAIAGPSIPFFARRLYFATLPVELRVLTVVAALLVPSWWEVWKLARHSTRVTPHA